MRFEKKHQINILLVLLLNLVGCAGTVVQKHVAPTSISYSGNRHDAGILADTKDGFLVDAEFIDRYNKLIDWGSKNLAHKIKRNQGVKKISNDRFIINREGMEDFLNMRDRQRDLGIKK